MGTDRAARHAERARPPPQATRWGWNATSSGHITVPVLVVHGLLDNVVAVNTSATLYSSLTGTSSKTIVQVGCASHGLFSGPPASEENEMQ